MLNLGEFIIGIIEVLIWHLPGRTDEKKHQNPQSG
jgi:hypothetical protein